MPEIYRPPESEERLRFIRECVAQNPGGFTPDFKFLLQTIDWDRASRTREPDDRFWEKVAKVDGDGCWEWTGAKNKDGYGICRATRGGKNGKGTLAHRFSYRLAHPDEPLYATTVVMHTCDNPPCVRPDHLVVGTHADNVADKVAKASRIRELEALLAARETPADPLPWQAVDPDTLARQTALSADLAREVRAEMAGDAARETPADLTLCGHCRHVGEGIALHFAADPTNHHNAARCPYCTPAAGVLAAPPSGGSEYQRGRLDGAQEYAAWVIEHQPAAPPSEDAARLREALDAAFHVIESVAALRSHSREQSTGAGRRKRVHVDVAAHRQLMGDLDAWLRVADADGLRALLATEATR